MKEKIMLDITAKDFKEKIDNIVKTEIKKTFQDNLMETLSSAFIFKYVKTLEKENKELKERINKIMEIIELNQYNYGYQIKEEILKGEENVKN